MIDELRFDDQVIVVTGAGRGLGAAYARLFALLGGTVIVHDAGVAPDGSGADATIAEAVVSGIAASGGTASADVGNLENPEACETLIRDALERYGRLDVLVHNAGVVLWESPDRPDNELWARTMAVNADAGFLLIRAALPHMRARGYGRIVVTTSERAMTAESAVPGLVGYAAAKMAQVGLMIGFRANVTDHDIQINAVAPVAATRLLRRDAPHLQPEHVAPGVAYLASRRCKSSGNVLCGSGGTFRLASWSFGPAQDLGDHATITDVAAVWQDLRGAT